MGSRADRGRVHRPGAPGHHPRRPGRGGEGPVPGHRRDHRGRPGQRVPAAPHASHHRPRAGVESLLSELRERIVEELDYSREAGNQQRFAEYYDGHPTIHVPKIVAELSTRRVVTSDLATGARFAELATWPQHERNLAAETIYRFVFRSLYDMRAFNGDPHPGNYLFHPGGRVTFLDFGLVKRFTRRGLAAVH